MTTTLLFSGLLLLYVNKLIAVLFLGLMLLLLLLLLFPSSRGEAAPAAAEAAGTTTATAPEAFVFVLLYHCGVDEPATATTGVVEASFVVCCRVVVVGDVARMMDRSAMRDVDCRRNGDDSWRCD